MSAEAAPAPASDTPAAAAPPAVLSSAAVGSDAHKAAGNTLFAAGRYLQAVNEYTEAIDGLDSASETERKERAHVLLTNRAFANLKAENYGSAIADADKALEANPTWIKAYYRRGSANLALARYKVAKKDFQAVLSIVKDDADAKAKLTVCDKAIAAARFAAAVATEATRPLAERLNIDGMTVDAAYAGPVLPAVPEAGKGASAEQCAADESAVNEHGISLGFVRQLLEHFRSQKMVHRKFALQLLARLKRVLDALPSLVHAPFPEGAARFNVCGDTHGQYYDTLNIWEKAGQPSPTNPFLFNGDFVDRGSFSVENVLALFAWKLLYPGHVHLTRGNHETANMNKMYGFEGEVRAKLDGNCMDMFAEVFRSLPLAVVIDKRVLVVHGGLFQKDGVTLEEIAKIDRFREPPESGLMSDILWSDPQPFAGRGPSKRGVGQSFGPDVTARFLESNGLQLLIRSHEVMDEGYQQIHGGKLITVFSAPRYCDSMENKGAVVHLDRDCKPSFMVFESVPHPPVRPMAYASGMSMFGL